MKIKMRDKFNSGDFSMVTRLWTTTEISLVLVFLMLINLSLATSSPNPLDIINQPGASRPKNDNSLYTRIKRQIFRQNIPVDRPLSGNLYAEHHGFPHPGRWFDNPQGIKPPNSNSGHHFESPNLILTDEDFNRYGSTLQHIDDMLYQARLRGSVNPPPQELQLLQQEPEFRQQLQEQPGPTQYVEPQVQLDYQSYGAPPAPPIQQQHNHHHHHNNPPVYNQPIRHHHQHHHHPPPPGVEYGQIHIVNNGPVSHNHISQSPPDEIIHHGSPNPVVPVVAHFHYNHQLGAVKGSNTVNYLPGTTTSTHHQQQQQPVINSAPSPSPQYGAELQLPNYEPLGPEDLQENIVSHSPQPPPPPPPPRPLPYKINPNQLRGPYVFNIRPVAGPPKFHSNNNNNGGGHRNHHHYGGYLPISRRPVRYSTRIPGSYSWSVSY